MLTGTGIGLRWSPPGIAPACREWGEDVVLGELALCPGRASRVPDLLHGVSP